MTLDPYTFTVAQKVGTIKLFIIEQYLRLTIMINYIKLWVYVKLWQNNLKVKARTNLTRRVIQFLKNFIGRFYSFQPKKSKTKIDKEK